MKSGYSLKDGLKKEDCCFKTKSGSESFTLNDSEIVRLGIWCKNSFSQINTINRKHTSYELKHLAENKSGIASYISNADFKFAMLAAGFKIDSPNKQNWCFNISEGDYKRIRDEPKKEILMNKLTVCKMDEIVKLKVYQGKSFKDTAAALGSSVSTVQKVVDTYNFVKANAWERFETYSSEIPRSYIEWACKYFDVEPPEKFWDTLNKSNSQIQAKSSAEPTGNNAVAFQNLANAIEKNTKTLESIAITLSRISGSISNFDNATQQNFEKLKDHINANADYVSDTIVKVLDGAKNNGKV